MTWLIDDLQDLALSIAAYISSACELIANIIFYPITMVSYWLSAIINLIFQPFIDLNTNLTTINNDIFNFTLDILTLALPLKFLIFITTSLIIVFVYRLYHFLKDIHILGNSI